MEDLLNLCRIIHNNMHVCPDLRSLEFPQGMKIIWEKMPDAFLGRWRKLFTDTQQRTGTHPKFQYPSEFSVGIHRRIFQSQFPLRSAALDSEIKQSSNNGRRDVIRVPQTSRPLDP